MWRVDGALTQAALGGGGRAAPEEAAAVRGGRGRALRGCDEFIKPNHRPVLGSIGQGEPRGRNSVTGDGGSKDGPEMHRVRERGLVVDPEAAPAILLPVPLRPTSPQQVAQAHASVDAAVRRRRGPQAHRLAGPILWAGGRHLVAVRGANTAVAQRTQVPARVRSNPLLGLECVASGAGTWYSTPRACSPLLPRPLGCVHAPG